MKPVVAIVAGLYIASITIGWGQYGLRSYAIGNGGAISSSSSGTVQGMVGGAAVGQAGGGGNGAGIGLYRSHRWIEILTPNSGDQWTVGTTNTIRWRFVGNIPRVRIALSTTGGSSWQELTSATLNVGSYEWIPQQVSSQAIVRAADQKDAIIRDESDGTFEIVEALLAVIAPTAGTVWQSGGNATIRWSSVGSLGPLELAYRVSSSAPWQPIASGVSNTGSYGWIVPEDPAIGAQIRIRTTSPPTVEAISDPFEIRSTTQTAFQLAVWLEGGYDASSGSMRIELEQQGYLPVGQPYGSRGYGGNEQRAGWIDGISDWVLLEFRSTTNVQQVVGQTAGLLMSDGRIIDESGYPQVLVSSSVVPAGRYYVVVEHRNHVSVMSSSGVEGEVGRATAGWDFRQGVGRAYQQFQAGQKQVGSVAVMVGGDVDGDGIINARDRVKSRNALFGIGYVSSDVTLDGAVNASDRTMIRNNVFWVTQVP